MKQGNLKPFQVIHSARKTIALIIRRDGQLVVRAPLRASNAEIMRFVEEKAAWIRAKQAEVKQRNARSAPRAFVPGEQFLFLGEAYPLEIEMRKAHAPLSLEAGRFLLASSAQPKAREFFTAWYRRQAQQVLEERSHALSARFGLQFQKVKITSAKTRWGSCSTNGTISFPWRLVMAPLHVIDYVVIHELAHLVERNHSSRFWTQVGAMLPEYAHRVQWLKENGYRLNLD